MAEGKKCQFPPHVCNLHGHIHPLLSYDEKSPARITKFPHDLLQSSLPWLQNANACPFSLYIFTLRVCVGVDPLQFQFQFQFLISLVSFHLFFLNFEFSICTSEFSDHFSNKPRKSGMFIFFFSFPISKYWWGDVTSWRSYPCRYTCWIHKGIIITIDFYLI